MGAMWGRIKRALGAYWAVVRTPVPNRDNCTADEYADWQDRNAW